MSMFLYAYVGLLSNFSYLEESRIVSKVPEVVGNRAQTPDLLLLSQEP